MLHFSFSKLASEKVLERTAEKDSSRSQCAKADCICCCTILSPNKLSKSSPWSRSKAGGSRANKWRSKAAKQKNVRKDNGLLVRRLAAGWLGNCTLSCTNPALFSVVLFLPHFFALLSSTHYYCHLSWGFFFFFNHDLFIQLSVDLQALHQISWSLFIANNSVQEI